MLRAIETDRTKAYLGFPESLFARLNSIWPTLINMGSCTQNRVARSFTKP